MHAKAVWKEKMTFEGVAGKHSTLIDAKPPIGNENGPTPKELIAIGLCGCTAMDVIALMRKYKQTVKHFEVSVDALVNEGVHPATIKEFNLIFKVTGDAIDNNKVIEAVNLSQTKYCAVSAMLSKSAPIRYTVEVNGQTIASGEADFKLN